jgi:hypothetical protein
VTKHEPLPPSPKSGKYVNVEPRGGKTGEEATVTAAQPRPATQTSRRSHTSKCSYGYCSVCGARLAY